MARRHGGKRATPNLIPPPSIGGVTPHIQPPKRQGANSCERHLQDVIRSQLKQRRNHCGETAGQPSKTWAIQTAAPPGNSHQQQAMPEAETPRRLIRRSSAHCHHAAVHQGRERGNFWGQIQQRIPPLPATSRKQSERTTMIQGAVEIVSLVPGGNATLQSPPQPIRQGGKEPNQGHSSPKAATLDHRMSRRRRSSCSRFRRCLASLSISRPSWR
jgi:hypothetical protein